MTRPARRWAALALALLALAPYLGPLAALAALPAALLAGLTRWGRT